MEFVMRLLCSISFLCLLSTAAIAQQQFPASLTGHAALPAASFIDAPQDAPDALKTSGKYAGATPVRIDAVGSVAGMDGKRETGLSFPFKGQPLQGFSGIRSMGDGTFWVVTDNGFGNRANSPDAMLMANRYAVDFKTGRVARTEGIFLSDPDKKVPFMIVNEGTEKRYLTGADFDLESFQIIGDKFWFGEEFGPYLIRTDRTGKVEAVFETMIEGQPVRSPDHFMVRTPAAPGGKVAFNVRRSKGFEGMAASKDGKFLYPLLEGALWNDAANATEKDDGREYLRILEFDVANQKWTGRFWKYPLEANGNSIGDFNMIDQTTGLIIERDDGEGIADKACAAGSAASDCFETPAKFKRVYKIELNDTTAGSAVRKIGHIDLLDIKDPDGRARVGSKNGVFQFPFFTIENVDVVDGEHIVVANDNNLPFSAGRQLDKADDNEFILLRVPEFLKAR